MPFVGRVVLEPIREAGAFDRGEWRVVEPLIYKSKRYNATISVPVDFKTDLASVPRILPVINMLAGGTGVRAAVIHDYIHHHPAYFNGERQMLPRDVGDDIFDEIMEEDQVPGWRRTLMWAGVRIFGWLSYGKREAGMREISLVLTILFAASGCVSLDKIIEAAGRDRASWCGRFVTGVGAGALVPGPGIPVGGYYGDVYVGRSNEPGSTVRVDSNGCEITHGKGG